MVKNVSQIVKDLDFSSEEDTRSLVFHCANHPEYDMPFALLTRYPVLDTYADYWQKGEAILRRSERLVEALFPNPEMEAEEKREPVPSAVRMALQKKCVKKYLKNHAKI
jgi:hypothetical protein